MSIEKVIREVTDAYGVDLDNANTVFFVNGLLQKIITKGAMSDQSARDIGKDIFFSIAKDTFGPLLSSFCYWSLKSYVESNRSGNVVFLARDAIPLYHISKTIAQETGIIDTEKIKLLYLTRKMCNLDDEIAQYDTQENSFQLVGNYCTQEGVVPESLLIDMGMYGSIYNVMTRHNVWTSNDEIALAFLYSKNPDILGYLNLVLGDTLLEEMRITCNTVIDCGECVNPQLHVSPGSLSYDGSQIVPLLEHTGNGCMSAWHFATILGYVKAAKEYLAKPCNPKEELLKIHDKILDARNGSWNGTLPYPTPEWSLREDFLNNTQKYRDEEAVDGWIQKKVLPLGSKDVEIYKKNIQND